MVGCHSILNPSDIPAHLQRRCSFGNVFLLCFSSPSGSFLNESAQFNEPKPFALHVTDDTWASLKLRIDPISREILDPRRVYFGAAILCSLISVVFQAVRPKFVLVDEEDDNYYSAYNAYGEDIWDNNDVKHNEWLYKNSGLRDDIKLMTLAFIFSLIYVFVVTMVVTVMMERRNLLVDNQILNICEEIRPRFEQEGYGICYKTRTFVSGILCGHFYPERVICFKELNQVECGSNINSINTTHAKKNIENSLTCNDKPLYGTINVMVPNGYVPGQVVNVMTPSGLPIMVAVPSGVKPGENFPVQIPAQMYKSQSSLAVTKSI